MGVVHANGWKTFSWDVVSFIGNSYGENGKGGLIMMMCGKLEDGGDMEFMNFEGGWGGCVRSDGVGIVAVVRGRGLEEELQDK